MENTIYKVQVASPGRINLIGEHIDYNDGFVLPAAIDKYIFFTLVKNGSQNLCTIKSKGFSNVLKVDLNEIKKGIKGWHAYMIGVLSEIQKLTDGLEGFDCEIESKVPVGSGVSSSAALECGLAYGLNELFGLGLDKWQLIRIGQNAEHHYVGTKCGIMDQFASVMGKEGHAIFLDCKSLEYEYVPTRLDPYSLLLLNTNVSHDLSTGEYNIRGAQCEEGLKYIANHFSIVPSFRNVNLEMLEETKDKLGLQLFKRCSYVVEEISRVVKAVKALKSNDLDDLGRLMYETHEGLSAQYEVSCRELDFLVALARTEPAILGARMMGGGFGGCTLNLIHKDAIAAFVDKASRLYKDTFALELSAFETLPSDGTSLLNKS
ncbi:galactokinase [Maribacter chungangensis]|uniref:Galactokinase n=1 Tax=Maribacter chungangensis TaxID=1069117 RepID=A0ABW3B7N0_9FLAO